MRRYSVITVESRGGLHAHIAFVGTSDIALRLKASKQFGELIDVRPITDNNSLARKYLAKERTPQAGYRRAHMLGGRILGSHRLPGAETMKGMYANAVRAIGTRCFPGAIRKLASARSGLSPCPTAKASVRRR